MDKKTLVQGLAASSIGFGAFAALAPAAMLTAYRTDASPTARAMARLWGTRNIALGVLLLQGSGAELNRLLGVGIALNLTDAALELLAPTLDGSPANSAVPAAATSAAVAALAGYAASLD